MGAVENLENRIRGWVPKEPATGIIKTANVNAKSGRWNAFPVVVSGALMIVASLLSFCFGILLLSAYQASVEYYNTANFYPALHVGILNLLAFVLGLFSGVLLLIRKHIIVSITSMVVVLTFGFASPLIFYAEGYMWENGLFLGSPMIAFSIATLVILGLNYRKLKQAKSDQNATKNFEFPRKEL
jgi:hypothetical protein